MKQSTSNKQAYEQACADAAKTDKKAKKTFERYDRAAKAAFTAQQKAENLRATYQCAAETADAAARHRNKLSPEK